MSNSTKQNERVNARVPIRNRGAGGWYWSQNELIDYWARIIGVDGVAVYGVLARYSRDGVVKDLSSRRIAQTLRRSRAQIFRTLSKLRAAGLVQIIGSSGQESMYVLADLKTLAKSPVSTLARPECSTAQVDQATGSGQASMWEAAPVAGISCTYRTLQPANKEINTEDCKTALPPTPLSREGGETTALDTDPVALPGMLPLNQSVWARVLLDLKSQFASVPAGVKLADEYDKYFRDTWQERVKPPNVIVIRAADPGLVRTGLQRYAVRIRQTIQRLFGVEAEVEIASE